MVYPIINNFFVSDCYLFDDECNFCNNNTFSATLKLFEYLSVSETLSKQPKSVIEFLPCFYSWKKIISKVFCLATNKDSKLLEFCLVYSIFGTTFIQGTTTALFSVYGFTHQVRRFLLLTNFNGVFPRNSFINLFLSSFSLY